MNSREPSRPLVLTEPRSAHAELWLAWRNQPESRRFNPLSDLRLSELRDRLADAAQDLGRAGALEYRWMIQSAETIVGTVAVSDISWSCGYGSLGIMLDAAHHRKGLGTAALGLLLTKIFDESALQRVWATVSVDNLASRRLFERLGFSHEGTLREHFVIEGLRVDQCIYGLLRREWQCPTVGGNLQPDAG